MAAKEKFMIFLESIKTEKNSKLIENVVKGFNACLEYGPEKTFISDIKTAMPMSVGIPSRAVKEYTPEAREEEFMNLEPEPEPEPELEPETVVAAVGEQDEATRKGIAKDLLDLISNNPEILEMFMKEMRKKGKI